MLKKNFKILSILFLLLTITFSTVSFADDETDAATILLNSDTSSEEASSEESTETSDDTTTDSTTTDDTTTDEDTEDEEEVTIKNYLGESAAYGDIYKIVTDSDYTIDYNVSGNIFIMGNNIKISSSYVHGDVYIMGNDVTIEDSEISGSAYIVANNFSIDNGIIYCSCYVAANNFNMYGYTLDLYVTANTLTIEENAYVEKDFHSSTKTLNLYGVVGRDAFCSFDEINLSKDGETVGGVLGDFNYSSSEEVDIPDGFVEGEVKFSKSEAFQLSFKYIALLILESIIFMLVILGILYVVSPKFVANSSDILHKSFGKVVLKGILFLILIPVISIALFLLAVTIRVALILIAVYLILIAISSAVFVIALSNLISNKLGFSNKLGKLGIFILTAIIYSVLYKVPYVGALIAIINGILGLGIIVQYISLGKKKKSKIIAEATAKVVSDESVDSNNDSDIENVQDENKIEDDDKSKKKRKKKNDDDGDKNDEDAKKDDNKNND